MSEPEVHHPCVEETTALVYETFRGVTREGGVSWSESYVRDDYGTPQQCAAARLADKESSWEELVDDPEWESQPGIGGYCFLDPIGFRYYLVPAMVRELRGQTGFNGSLDYELTHNEFYFGKWAALRPEERQCICEVLKCLIAQAVESSAGDPEDVWRAWEDAYRSYWMAIDENPLDESKFG